MSNPGECDHLNLTKVEEDKEKGHSVFKCLGCGRLIAKDRQICTLCGDIPVDNIVDHMSRIHKFDVNRWNAVTGLGNNDRDQKVSKDLI